MKLAKVVELTADIVSINYWHYLDDIRAQYPGGFDNATIPCNLRYFCYYC